MDIIINKLYMIKKEPRKYIREKSVIFLRIYISGYIRRELELNPSFTTIFYKFNDFIYTQYKNVPNISWENIITANSNSDEEAFDLFYVYLEEFIKRNYDKKL